MRTHVVAFLWACSGTAFAQLPATSVTFTCRASTAAHVLAELSKVCGAKLEAGVDTAAEVLVISAKQVPLADLMARIATATSGKWEAKSGGYVLLASDGMRQKEEEEAVAKRLTALRKAVQDGMAPPKANKTSQDQQAQVQAATISPFGVSGDVGHHAYEVLNCADLTSVAAMRANDRIVFSTRPTAMQRPFESDVSASVNAIVTSHNADIAKNPHATDDASAQFGEQAPAFLKSMIDRMGKPIGAVAKVVLVVACPSFGAFGMMQVTLRMYDAQGKTVFDQPINVELPGSGMSALIQQAQESMPGHAKAPTPAKSTPVELSDDSKAMDSAFSSAAAAGGKSINLSPAVKDKLFHPDRFDPLSFSATDEVLSMAKKQGRPVVADLSDQVAVANLFMQATKPTVEQVEKQLADGLVNKIVADPAWLVIKPADPGAAREARLDRGALTTLLLAAQTKGLASLDDVAEYSQHSPSPMDGGIGLLYVMFFVPGAFAQGMSGITSWEMMRVYGSLDPVRRDTLRSGGSLPFISLTAYQMEQVKKMAFGAMPMLQVEDPGRKPEDAMPGILRMFMGGGSDDYRDEPTEILPRGLPGDGFLTMKTSNEQFAAPVTAAGAMEQGPQAILDVETLATYKMMKESPMFAQASGSFPSPAQARIGQRTVYAFTFHVAPKVSIDAALNDNRLDASSPIVSMNSLPTDFQKAIDDKAIDLKKSPLGALGAMSMFGGATGIRP